MNAMARESLSDMAAIAPAKLMPHRDFLRRPRGPRNRTSTLQALCDRLSWPERGGQSRHLNDEPLLSPDRRHGQRPLVALASRIARTSVATAPNDWRTYRGLIDPRRPVFIDETWTRRPMPCPPARLGIKGPAARRQGSRRGKSRTAAFHRQRLAQRPHRSRPAPFDGAHQRRKRFHAYVEQFLVPTLKPGDVVILDNLGSHKGKAVRKAIRNVGARLVFLPKYSPDLNPIEQLFAKFKTLLRKAGGAESYEALSDACGEILAQYPPAECAAYLKNAGYA